MKQSKIITVIIIIILIIISLIASILLIAKSEKQQGMSKNPEEFYIEDEDLYIENTIY